MTNRIVSYHTSHEGTLQYMQFVQSEKVVHVSAISNGKVHRIAMAFKNTVVASAYVNRCATMRFGWNTSQGELEWELYPWLPIMVSTTDLTTIVDTRVIEYDMERAEEYATEERVAAHIATYRGQL